MQPFHLATRLPALGLVLLMIAAFLSGCGQAASDNAATRVGVVDLDRIARETGRTDQMEQQLRQRLNEANEQFRRQLEELQNQANAEINRLSEQFGPEPTPDQQQQLLGIQQQARAAAERMRLELNQRQQTILADLRRQFRDEIRPALNEIARERGITIVLTTGEGVLTYDPSLDLTDAAIERLR
jgi:Skp family chaperone for outer membrane proteins